MERAGGSCNTLQIIAHPRSPLYSPSLTPPTYLFSLLSFHLSDTFPLSSAQYLHLRIIHFSFFNFPLFFFFFIRPLRDDREAHQAHSQQMVAVVCKRSVLSKQTHWAICFSTLHQAGSSEESAHHFNQPRRHTMNF